MKLKTGTVLIALISICLVMSACGHAQKGVSIYGEAAEQDKIRLKFYGNINATDKMRSLEELINEYMKENPNIAITYEGLEPSAKLDYNELLIKRLESGSGDDIFLSFPGFLPTLIAGEYVEDLSRLSTIENYAGSLDSSLTVSGHFYGLPLERTVIGMYCNMEVLNKYGISVPKDYEEFLAALELLKQEGMTPIAASNLLPTAGYIMADGLSKLYSGSDTDKIITELNTGDRQVGDIFEEGFGTLKLLIDNGYIDKETALENDTALGAERAFIEGESAFLVATSDVNASIMAVNENLEYKIIPIPIRQQAGVLMSTANHFLCVNKNSKYKEAAMDFVEFCTSRKNVEYFTDNMGSLSPFTTDYAQKGNHMNFVSAAFKAGNVVPSVDYRMEFRLQHWLQRTGIEILKGASVSEAKEYLNELIEIQLKERENK